MSVDGKKSSDSYDADKFNDAGFRRSQEISSVIETHQIRKSFMSENRDSEIEQLKHTRSSTKQLLKESKNGRRQSSFGSARPDFGEESRDSSSIIPSYMQATESAKAKALMNTSPRSTPDLQDKDIYIKKWHSLPRRLCNAFISSAYVALITLYTKS
ncbi:hypothetical protein GIB67_009605 [Kingdonia uniflora]|uniref:DUF4005 domain-containing protein n=1 Tax=Kingdonia uniflora TaxID=39325 RepID=A0A7J7N893_9MAGN|nr:hypothetical protein GIB67_009605 [Kingdonia uniflora]